MSVPRRGGRPATISLAAIEQAVIDIGFDCATTTTVAARLGVDQSSLYRHITSKQSMMYRAINRLIDSVDWSPEAEDWESYLRGIAATMWSLMADHPGFAARLYELDRVTPASRAMQQRAVARLVDFGWGIPEAVLILDAIGDMTGDAVLRLQTGPDLADLAEQFRDSEDQADPISDEIDKYVIDVLGGDPREWWQRKLDLLLAGARYTLAPHPNGEH